MGVIGLFVFFAFSPWDFRDWAKRKREHLTQQAASPMEIAMVWPRSGSNLFVEGAEMAVREINQRGGITIADGNGNPVKTRIEMRAYDEFRYPQIEKLAARIGRNLNLSAVIGHSEPDSAIRASITYRDCCLLYLSPAVSDARLTQYGFWSTVRTIPEDSEISRAMITFALQRGWRKAAILYVRNTYGITYDSLWRAGMGELSAYRLGETNEVSSIELVFHGHYAENERSFYPLISTLLKEQFEVVFLADSLVGNAQPRTLALIAQMREMGINQPILGTEELHSKKLWPALGQKANGIFAANVFSEQPSHSNRVARQFWMAFRKYYGHPPTMHAKEAYEAVMLLAQAAERAQSKLPLRMATILRSTPRWNGLQGEGVYHFDQDGGIQGKRVIVEQMEDGNFCTPEIPEVCAVQTNQIETPMKKARN